MAIDIDSRWALDYDATQLKRERKAYERRISVGEGLQKKFDATDFNSKPVKLDNQEYMLVRMLLAADAWEQGKVVDWINTRLRARAQEKKTAKASVRKQFGHLTKEATKCQE